MLRDFARAARRRPRASGRERRSAGGPATLVLHEAMRRQIEVQLELAEALPPVVGQRGPAGQAVLSLVLLNAVDASPARGESSSRRGSTDRARSR